MTRFLRFAIALFAVVFVITACKPSKQPTPTERFIQLLGSPAPASLKDVRYDWFGMGDPSYFLSFSVTAADMQTLIQRRQFVPTTEAAPPNGERPKWWQPTELSEPRSLYKREQKRSWEYLWLDSTGTKAYYMFWGL